MNHRLFKKLRKGATGPVVLFIIFLAIFTFLAWAFSVPKSGQNPFWWALSHLIDPGFIADDVPSKTNVCQSVLGVLTSLMGLFLLMTMIMNFAYDSTKDLYDKLINGSLPKKMKDHRIIIGPSDQLIAYADAHEDEAISEVTVLIATDNGGLKRLERVVSASFCSYEITVEDLRKSKTDLQAEFAQEIILLEGVASNAGVIINFIEKILHERSDQPINKLKLLKLSVEITSDEADRIICRLCSTEQFEKLKISLELTNLTSQRARQLLLDHPLDNKSKAKLADTVAPILIIDGWSDLARELIIQVRSAGLYAEKATVIMLHDPSSHFDIEDLMGTRVIEDSYRSELQVMDIKHYKTIQSLRDAVEHLPHYQKRTKTLLVCGGNSDLVMGQATLWEVQEPWIKPPNNPLNIWVELSDSSSYRQIESRLFTNSFKITAERSLAINRMKDMDHFPAMNHEDYQLNIRKIGEDSVYSKWTFLPHQAKGWNRSPIDHLQIKLRLLANEWALPHPTFDSKNAIEDIDPQLKARILKLIDTYHEFSTYNLETYFEKVTDHPDLLVLNRFAKWEHDRWSSERFVTGWRWHKGKKDNNTRHHPHLIPYDNLEKEIKIKDHHQLIKQLSARVK
jgi:hypothetical protein